MCWALRRCARSRARVPSPLAPLSGTRRGASLRLAPSAVTLTFPRSPAVLVGIRCSRRRKRYEDGAVESVGSATIRAGLRELGRGVYTVSWRVVSRVDGHLTAGAFAFGVRVDPARIQAADVESSSPPLSPLEPIGRFGLYAGLALIVGASWASPPSSAGSHAAHAAVVGSAWLPRPPVW